MADTKEEFLAQQAGEQALPPLPEAFERCAEEFEGLQEKWISTVAASRIVRKHAALAATPKAPPQPDRIGRTYYKNNDCKAASADAADCICWRPSPALAATPAARAKQAGCKCNGVPDFHLLDCPKLDTLAAATILAKRVEALEAENRELKAKLNLA